MENAKASALHTFNQGDFLLLPATCVHAGAGLTYDDTKPKVRKLAIHCTIRRGNAASSGGDTFFVDPLQDEWLTEVVKLLRRYACYPKRKSFLVASKILVDAELHALYNIYLYWDRCVRPASYSLCRLEPWDSIIDPPGNELTVSDYHEGTRKMLLKYDEALEVQHTRFMQFCLHLALHNVNWYGNKTLIEMLMPTNTPSLNAQLYKALRWGGRYHVAW